MASSSPKQITGNPNPLLEANQHAQKNATEARKKRKGSFGRALWWVGGTLFAIFVFIFGGKVIQDVHSTLSQPSEIRGGMTRNTTPPNNQPLRTLDGQGYVLGDRIVGVTPTRIDIPAGFCIRYNRGDQVAVTGSDGPTHHRSYFTLTSRSQNSVTVQLTAYPEKHENCRG